MSYEEHQRRERAAANRRLAIRAADRKDCPCGAPSTVFDVDLETWFCQACSDRMLTAWRAECAARLGLKG
jgi:hypothetical protein